MNAFLNLGKTSGDHNTGREYDRDGKKREIFLSDGNVVIAESRDPYGFWYIRMEKGRTPDALLGTYTNAELAVTAALSYYNNNYFKKTEVSERVEPPILKTKTRTPQNAT